jgi:RNA polymerase sigma-32 factor
MTEPKKRRKPLEIQASSQASQLPVPAKERDVLQIYIRELSRLKLLTPEEEKKLTTEYALTQDPALFKRLVQANLRFVVKIAFEYSTYGAKVMDLIQEGNLGLMKAVRDFNPYKEVRLTTYAVWWIRSYIQDYLIRNWSLVRIGTTASQKKLFYRLKK